jgi:hypothetical protein
MHSGAPRDTPPPLVVGDSGLPPAGLPVPAPVAAEAGAARVRPVWVNELGVADRWADLAIATWSTTWNYGPGWETALLDAYGIAPDPDRTRYYRLLWDLGP